MVTLKCKYSVRAMAMFRSRFWITFSVRIRLNVFFTVIVILPVTFKSTCMVNL